MFKTKLQELCQKRRWEMPEYMTQKEGLSHNPRFNTTLTVNGLTFNNQTEFRSLKLSQNEAAKLALLHFNSSPSSTPSQQSPPLPPPPQQHQQHRALTSPLLPPPPALDTDFSFPQPSFSPPTQQPSRLPLSPDQSCETVVADDMQTERRKSQVMVEKFPPFPPNQVLKTAKSDTAFVGPKIIKGPSSESMVDENAQTDITKFQAKIAEMFPPGLPNDVLTSAKDDTAFGDMQHLYKNQLQQYTQRRGLSLPVYTCDCEGPPHASRFRCRVTVGGKTYESAEFYCTIKSAEHAAAMIALMSLSPDGAQEDDTGIYKNLLQELVQKKGLALPVYSTTRSGQPHTPIFVSSLEVGGQAFAGQEAKTKKQAEMNVAKIAYFALKDGEGKNKPSSLVQSPIPQSISSRLQSNVMDMKHQTGLGIPINYSSTAKSENQAERDEYGSSVYALGKNKPSSLVQSPIPQSISSRLQSNVMDMKHQTGLGIPINYSSTVESENQAERDEIRGYSKATCHQSAILPAVSVAAPSDQRSSSSCNLNGHSSSASNYPSPCYDNASLVKNSNGSLSVPTSSRRVVVLSRKSNVEIQDGLSLLPFSDENWAAYSNFKQ